MHAWSFFLFLLRWSRCSSCFFFVPYGDFLRTCDWEGEEHGWRRNTTEEGRGLGNSCHFCTCTWRIFNNRDLPPFYLYVHSPLSHFPIPSYQQRQKLHFQSIGVYLISETPIASFPFLSPLQLTFNTAWFFSNIFSNPFTRKTQLLNNFNFSSNSLRKWRPLLKRPSPTLAENGFW